MPVYYQLCDVFMIPRPSTLSAETLTPLKILEAMAMEKVVLVSNVGGMAEAIRHGENGYLFSKGNIGELKRVLLNIIQEDCIGIGKNARESVLKKYTWEISANILQKIYRRLI